MKKLLISVILAIISVFGCLFAASCKDGESENKDDIAYYNVEVTGIDSHFYEQLKDKYKAGEEVEVKLHSITDVDLYVFVNEKRIDKSHYDSDYWGYKFTMPEENIEILITSDAYHGVEICDFKDVFYLLDYFENEEVVKIKCEKGYIGVNPDSLAQVTYTTDKIDIENILEIFNHKLKPDARNDKDGGNYIKYTFYTDNEREFELPISNGFAELITFSTCDFFEIVGFSAPQISNPDIQCSKFNLGSCLVYSDEELQNSTGKHAYLGYLEFNECEESADGKIPVAYIDTRFGTLKVIDDKTFEYKDKTYKVVGKQDFSTIIRT